MSDHPPTADDERTERGDDPASTQRAASVDRIRETYATQADRMARLSWLNRLLTGRYRRQTFGRAAGRVLDVACGTGLNLRYLPGDVEYVGVDISPEMLAKARERHGTGPGVSFREMDAGALAFEDDSFDAVVSSLSTCTFPGPVEALREMGRVCRPGGRVLLVEHGRSDVAPVARLQAWRADTHFENHACRLTQRPLENVAAAGLDVRETTTGLLGILTTVEAAPGDGGG